MAPPGSRILAAAAAGLVLLAIDSCHVTRMHTVVGRHAIIHWSSEGPPLCAGTLEYVDSSLEIVANTYEVSLPEQPAIEILWATDELLASDGLCPNVAGFGCDIPFPNGTNFMITWDLLNTHELAHAVRLTGDTHGMPAFFGEGVAVRWEQGPSRRHWEAPDNLEYVDYPQVREWFDDNSLAPYAYAYAGFFWTWLEAQHGGPRMASFAAKLGRFSRADEIEPAFEQTFGLTVSAAVEAFRDQPPLVFDIHACSMTQLPTLTWQGQPLQLSAPSSCAADNVVSSWEGPIQLSRLVLPDDATFYDLTLAGPHDTIIGFYACTGGVRPYAPPREVIVGNGDTILKLAGHYVVSSLSSLDDDGEVTFAEAWLVP